MITNTHSVGVVRDAVVDWLISDPVYANIRFALPVVAETYDGVLNDINGFHIKKEHVFAALNSATSAYVTEGNVGGGTGMICNGFKGGIGTASRQVGSHTVGVMVQCNYGSRRGLKIAGVPVGVEIPDLMPEFSRATQDTGLGSIIVVVATDAPLLPHQLKRLARRVPMGIGRMGGIASNGSGDIFIAFSTANQQGWHDSEVATVEVYPNSRMTPLFGATVAAVEEAIVNAMVAARTMEGINGNRVHAIPHDRLQAILERYGRLEE